MARFDPEEVPAASSETAREINRRIILNLIRNRQPISRADLARFSGLQRSTVSLIIEELIADRWVLEGPTGRLPRGRRPTFLHLNHQRAILCVDIRPSRTTIGISDINGRFSSQEVMPTLVNPDAALRELIKRLQPLLKKRTHAPFEGIGISLPGRIDAVTQELIFAPNLKWPVTDLKRPIERATGLEVSLENAANACALAEMWFGRLGNIRNLVAITVSEGIGTGIIAEGRLVRSRTGMAGEFGHVPLDKDGPVCSCGNHGCWEVLASNRAALRYYFEYSKDARRSIQRGLQFPDLLLRAEGSDTLAAQALDKMAVQLARGLRMIVAALAPEVILFVGEFTAAWEHFKPRLQKEVQRQNISSA
ncbi:MAG: ROK family transcriptional regulator, partial [Acidobacteriaceae bacterium]|nr:ROK family transcriptional regulator [Acidobacteriaceae bacterium]